MSDTPVYAQEDVEPNEDSLKKLKRLASDMTILVLRKMELETELESVSKQLSQYEDKLVPDLMSEIGIDSIKTAGGGMVVEMKEFVIASLPKDPEKRMAAFAYLKESGNDGLIKRSFMIQYGRDSTEWAERFAAALEEMGVSEHATVEQTETVNHQSMLKLIRDSLKSGEAIPMEAFGAFVKKSAKIKKAK